MYLQQTEAARRHRAMNLSRRQFLHLAACAARKGANLSDAVSAQDRSLPGRRLDRRSRAPDGQRLSVRLFQFPARHRASRRRHEQVPCHGGAPLVLARTIPKFIAYARANPAWLPWLPWLQREFGWTDRYALNYMR